VIGYRLLPPAEEEMTEAALYYEAARSGFGDIFLDDYSTQSTRSESAVKLAQRSHTDSVASCSADFPLALSTLSKRSPS